MQSHVVDVGDVHPLRQVANGDHFCDEPPSNSRALPPALVMWHDLRDHTAEFLPHGPRQHAPPNSEFRGNGTNVSKPQILDHAARDVMCPCLEMFEHRQEEHRRLLEELQRRVEKVECHVEANYGHRVSRTRASVASAPVRSTHVEVEDSFTLSESVWDASLLVGLPKVGVVGNLSIVTALFLNVGIQALLCEFLRGNSLRGSFPSTDEVNRWRFATAHDAMWADSITGSSLASRVCAGDESLGVSTSQLSLVAELKDYTEAFASVPQGALLCTLVCCMRFTLFAAELRKSARFLSFVCGSRIRRGERGSRRTSVSRDSSGVKVEVGTARFLTLCALVVVRVSFLVFTFVMGVMWVTQTTDLYFVLVSSSALKFFFDLDKDIFNGLLNRSTRSLVTEMQPLRTRRSSLCATTLSPCTLALTPWLGLVLLIALLVPTLQGNIETMSALLHELCGGNVDFVASSVDHLDWVTIAESEPYSDVFTPDLESLALEEAVWIENLDDVTLSWFSPSRFWFELMSVIEVGQRPDVANFCTDYDLSDFRWLNVFQTWGSVSDVSSCADVRQHCFLANASILRSACPRTCGCAHPQSGLALSDSVFGCPTSACRATESFKVASQEIACETPRVETLQVNANWTSQLASMQTLFKELGEFQEALLVEQVSLQGCSAVSLYDASGVLCRSSVFFPSLTAWCPVECGCRVPPHSSVEGYSDRPCPPQCDDWRSRYLEFLGLKACADLDGSARTLESDAALELHFEVFGTFSLNLNHSQYESVRSDGCEGLDLKWCGSPWMMRSLCPVLCGCIEAPRQVGCPSSCVDSGALQGSANTSLA